MVSNVMGCTLDSSAYTGDFTGLTKCAMCMWFVIGSNPKPAMISTHHWWKPKATSLLNILYTVMFIGTLPFSRSLLLLVPAVVTIAGIGSFGHLLNDWFDVEADSRANKENRLTHVSLWQKSLLVSVALVVALLPWIILPSDRLSVILLIGEFLLLVFYAPPPLRLKERIYLAPIADAAYAYAVPAALAAHTSFLASGKLYDPLFVGAF